MKTYTWRFHRRREIGANTLALSVCVEFAPSQLYRDAESLRSPRPIVEKRRVGLGVGGSGVGWDGVGWGWGKQSSHQISRDTHT